MYSPDTRPKSGRGVALHNNPGPACMGGMVLDAVPNERPRAGQGKVTVLVAR